MDTAQQTEWDEFSEQARANRKDNPQTAAWLEEQMLKAGSSGRVGDGEVKS